ncbi:MAG: antitoxin [Chromatiaceae bacterium]|nr:antitoxin [Chromatiaceae bacterium]MCF7995658.1 antitoxin [Chromatiaceae bacterium]
MASIDSETEQQGPIWELVGLSDYRLPSAPTATSARRGLSSLMRLFGRRQPASQGPVKTEDELHRLEPERLEAIISPIDWHPAAQLLQQALEQRSKLDPAWFIISPPAAGYAGLLETWAAQQAAACIPSPTYEIVAGDHSGWLADLPAGDAPWALPRLERCWLRHPAGLGLVRELFDRLLSGKLGFGLIGCDSWAWAYLRYVVPTQAVRALTLQALDGERLANWLGQLAAGGPAELSTGSPTGSPTVKQKGTPTVTPTGTSTGLPNRLSVAHSLRPRRFRHAQSGNLLLSVNDDDEIGLTSELRYLAAQSRGNPGVALQLWRSRLRSEPDKPEAVEAEADDESDAKADEEAGDKSADKADGKADGKAVDKASDKAGDTVGDKAGDKTGDRGSDKTGDKPKVETIWVAPAVEYALPSGLDEAEALILHALLLHDGLPTEVVEGLLPHARFQTHSLLLQLAAVEVIRSEPDGCWRVTAFAYAAVRSFLAGRRFLVDDV